MKIILINSCVECKYHDYRDDLQVFICEKLEKIVKCDDIDLNCPLEDYKEN